MDRYREWPTWLKPAVALSWEVHRPRFQTIFGQLKMLRGRTASHKTVPIRICNQHPTGTTLWRLAEMVEKSQTPDWLPTCNLNQLTGELESVLECGGWKGPLSSTTERRSVHCEASFILLFWRFFGPGSFVQDLPPPLRCSSWPSNPPCRRPLYGIFEARRHSAASAYASSGAQVQARLRSP